MILLKMNTTVGSNLIKSLKDEYIIISNDMRIDKFPAKFDNYESGYDITTKTITKHPAVFLSFDDEQERHGVLIHKWQISDKKNKGDFIACLELDKIEMSNHYESFLAYFQSNSNMFLELEKGTLPKEFSIHIFKFSINQWRKVSMKKTKWDYIDSKPLKESPCYIQRVLLS